MRITAPRFISKTTHSVVFACYRTVFAVWRLRQKQSIIRADNNQVRTVNLLLSILSVEQGDAQEPGKDKKAHSQRRLRASLSQRIYPDRRRGYCNCGKCDEANPLWPFPVQACASG